jgi:hypothetical protein
MLAGTPKDEAHIVARMEVFSRPEGPALEAFEDEWIDQHLCPGLVTHCARAWSLTAQGHLESRGRHNSTSSGNGSGSGSGRPACSLPQLLLVGPPQQWLRRTAPRQRLTGWPFCLQQLQRHSGPLRAAAAASPQGRQRPGPTIQLQGLHCWHQLRPQHCLCGPSCLRWLRLRGLPR